MSASQPLPPRAPASELNTPELNTGRFDSARRNEARPLPFAPEAMVHLTPRMAEASAPVLRADLPRGDGMASEIRSDPSRRLAPKAGKVKPRHGLYAGAWGVFGLLAGAYVFTLVLKQDGGPLLIARGDADAASVAKTQADVARLQQTVGQLGTDVARIKIDQAQIDEREKQMAQRVASVETRVEQFSGQLVQAQAAAQPPAPPTAKVAKAPPAPAPAPVAQAPAPQPAARLATGALPSGAPAAATAAVPQDGAAGLLLARGPSLDALRLSWSLLNERHKGTLKTMEPRVVEVEPGSYQLIAGPVANPAEALKVCATLKSRGVACQAADFKGNAL